MPVVLKPEFQLFHRRKYTVKDTGLKIPGMRANLATREVHDNYLLQLTSS